MEKKEKKKWLKPKIKEVKIKRKGSFLGCDKYWPVEDGGDCWDPLT